MPQELEPLTKTLKPIYANFAFSEQPSAIAFAKLVPEHDWAVGGGLRAQSWAVAGHRAAATHPVFQEITVWLATLSARAATAGGELDGWTWSICRWACLVSWTTARTRCREAGRWASPTSPVSPVRSPSSSPRRRCPSASVPA